MFFPFYSLRISYPFCTSLFSLNKPLFIIKNKVKQNKSTNNVKLVHNLKITKLEWHPDSVEYKHDPKPGLMLIWFCILSFKTVCIGECCHQLTELCNKVILCTKSYCINYRMLGVWCVIYWVPFSLSYVIPMMSSLFYCNIVCLLICLNLLLIYCWWAVSSSKRI